MTRQSPAEPIIEPGLPIVDAHHHLWFLSQAALAARDKEVSIAARAFTPTIHRCARYLFDEFMTDLNSGHNVRASVFVDAHAMYRASGPDALKSVGEVEFANGVAAMAASGVFGEVKICAGIVGNVDPRLGDAAEDVLGAHLRVGGGRYRGVRCAVLMGYDDDSTILGSGIPHLLLDGKFRAGIKCLQRLGLSFDAFVLEPQLPELIDLARTFPETQIILNHVGVPVGVGRYAGLRDARFPIWRDNIRTLSACPNVTVKLGGLGIPFGGFKSYGATPPATSSQLADEWRPYIETCIEAFGVERCMFESNCPVDKGSYSYGVGWNAFKRLAQGATSTEKTALFGATATRFYRLDDSA
jgi:predicted TIM-barrel fold metal-dependent hydrolase